MKTRTYIIAGIIAFLIGLLITYAGFVFILLEANPLKWSRDPRIVFTLFGWIIPVFATLGVIAIIKVVEEQKSKP